jgi:hypothetical protein
MLDNAEKREKSIKFSLTVNRYWSAEAVETGKMLDDPASHHLFPAPYESRPRIDFFRIPMLDRDLVRRITLRTIGFQDLIDAANE